MREPQGFALGYEKRDFREIPRFQVHRFRDSGVKPGIFSGRQLRTDPGFTYLFQNSGVKSRMTV